MIDDKLELLGNSFEPFLSASNPAVVKSLEALGYEEDEIRRIELFDWFQGVGLYGYFELYRLTNNEKYLKLLVKYYDTRICDGLPEKNINSMAPMLTLIHLLDGKLIPEYKTEEYWKIIRTWAEWLYEEAPRTSSGGLAHKTCEAVNREEMWDDTLFMSVLFLAKAGVVLKIDDYVEEAIFQFYTHQQYLTDRKTGFWFHGWTFDGHHNFVEALWARGNSWITIFVPIFLEICEGYPLSKSTKRIIVDAWKKQVEGLLRTQAEDGLWPTLLNDQQSYSEASAAAGFVWGIQKARRMGLLDETEQLTSVIEKAISAICNCINKGGVLEMVSGGTAMGKKSLDFYRDIPIIPKPYGQAMAMMALIESQNRVKHEKVC